MCCHSGSLLPISDTYTNGIYTTDCTDYLLSSTVIELFQIAQVKRSGNAGQSAMQYCCQYVLYSEADRCKKNIEDGIIYSEYQL